jgi:YhgE/Pip-like protein
MAGRKPVIQAVVTSLILALVPAAFAGMMVWAMQDPLNRLDRVPAAVVNEDTRVSIDSGDSTTSVDLGQEIVDNLFDKDGGDNFAWTVTSASDAASGLRDGRYFVVLTIPKAFSEDATSTAGADPKDPRTAELTVTTNDALNYLTGTISRSMSDSIAATVSQKVAAKYVENVQLHFNDLHDNLSNAVDKTVKLVDGADMAGAGATKLVDGLGTLRSKVADMPAKATKLKTGAKNLVNGAGKLKTGADNLYGGATGLAGGAATASANAGKLSNGASTLATNLGALDTGAGRISSALAQLDANYGSMSDAQRKAMLDQLNDLTTLRQPSALAGLDAGRDPALRRLPGDQRRDRPDHRHLAAPVAVARPHPVHHLGGTGLGAHRPDRRPAPARGHPAAVPSRQPAPRHPRRHPRGSFPAGLDHGPVGSPPGLLLPAAGHRRLRRRRTRPCAAVAPTGQASRAGR